MHATDSLPGFRLSTTTQPLRRAHARPATTVRPPRAEPQAMRGWVHPGRATSAIARSPGYLPDTTISAPHRVRARPVITDHLLRADRRITRARKRCWHATVVTTRRHGYPPATATSEWLRAKATPATPHSDQQATQPAAISLPATAVTRSAQV